MSEQIRCWVARYVEPKSVKIVALLAMLVMAAGAPASGGGFGWP